MIEINKKYGCLLVLDSGNEFLHFADSMIERVVEEKSHFKTLVENGKLEQCNVFSPNDPSKKWFLYKSETLVSKREITETDFDDAVNEWQNKKVIPHYKCKCKWCGKIRYYSEDTLNQLPQYCYRPMYFSQRYTRSISSLNSQYRKEQRYRNNEAIDKVHSINDVVPADDYCDKWNTKRNRELELKANNIAKTVASQPRKFAKNYSEDYTGRQYESLLIQECKSKPLEIVLVSILGCPYKPMVIKEALFTELAHRQRVIFGPVTVYKEYKCRCVLCGKEQTVTCDKFGINPPTQYGYTAYNGYWSDVSCDCHSISSFQWIVCKILFEAGANYSVEYSFPDLFGMKGKNLLRFDFVVFENNGQIKCLIECQGEQHYYPVEEYGGATQYQQQLINDQLKQEYALSHNIPLIKLSYKDKNIKTINAILKANGVV